MLFGFLNLYSKKSPFGFFAVSASWLNISGYGLGFGSTFLPSKIRVYPSVVFKKKLEISKNPNGNFYEDRCKKPNSNEEFDKISFIKQYENYI